MNPERRRFATKSLTGFAISPNPETHDLEGVLGIKFGNPPSRVDLGLRNRLVIVARERRIDPLKNGGRIAYYDVAYNAYFIQTGLETRLTPWHENVHGCIYSVNENVPEFPRAIDLFADKAHGMQIDSGHIERLVAGKALNEGLAEWATYTTAKEAGTAQEIEIATTRIHDIYEGDRNSILERGRRQLKSSTDQANSILLEPEPQGIGVSSLRKLGHTLADIKNVVYHVGYDFIDQAIVALKNRGFSVAAAIDYLIKNPPTTINHIEHPDRYVAFKLKKTFKK